MSRVPIYGDAVLDYRYKMSKNTDHFHNIQSRFAKAFFVVSKGEAEKYLEHKIAKGAEVQIVEYLMAVYVLIIM